MGNPSRVQGCFHRFRSAFLRVGANSPGRGEVDHVPQDRKALAEPVTQLLNDQPGRKRGRRGDIDAVEITVSLRKSKGRRAPHRIVEIKPFDRLLTRNDLLVTVAPAEPQQIVAERPGQVAEIPICVDAEGRHDASVLGVRQVRGSMEHARTRTGHPNA